MGWISSFCGILAWAEGNATHIKRVTTPEAITASPVPSVIPFSLPPVIASVLKPAVYKRVVNEREIITSANLESGHYSYSASMLVRAGLQKTRRVLTDYQLYSKLVPYVDRTDYSPIARTLDVEGGVWKFRLHSWVRFEERGERWIHYQIVAGHFRGLEGNIYFESLGEKGTLVYFAGDQYGTQWPPKFVIERGAEIVFGFTARRMRNYLESSESPKFDETSPKQEQIKPNDDEIPKPRSHL